MARSDPAPGWFRRHFNEDYRIIYRGRDQAQAEVEAAFAIRELEIERGERVLDLCCGFGRHLAAFQTRGIAAVGADLSLPLLRQVDRANRCVVCADMRALPFAGGPSGFGVVVNFFTSFGYFEADEEHHLAAREVSRVLRPGGRFCMDLMNARSAIRGLKPRSEREAGPFVVVEERRYDATRRRIEKTTLLSRTDSCETKRYFESVRVFEPEEIAALLGRAGLGVDRLLGDFGGSPCDSDSLRMIVLGRKDPS